MMLPSFLGFLLLNLPVEASAQSECMDPITGAPQPVLQMVLAGTTENEQSAELQLQLELQLLVDRACLRTQSIEDSDFHQMTISQQQSLLAQRFPEALMMLWLDSTDTQQWRAMLLTGAPPRTVLRVVESAPSTDALPALAIAVTETLKRLQVAIHSQPISEPAIEQSLPSPEPPTISVMESNGSNQPSNHLGPFGVGLLVSTTGPNSIGPQWTPGLSLFGTHSIGTTNTLSIRATAQHSLGTETKLFIATIGARLGRDFSNMPLRPSMGVELQQFRLQAWGQDRETHLTRFGNLNGQVGLEYRPKDTKKTNGILGLHVGAPIRTIEVKRRSDDISVWSAGPFIVRLEIAIERN